MIVPDAPTYAETAPSINDVVSAPLYGTIPATLAANEVATASPLALAVEPDVTRTLPFITVTGALMYAVTVSLTVFVCSDLSSESPTPPTASEPLPTVLLTWALSVAVTEIPALASTDASSSMFAWIVSMIVFVALAMPPATPALKGAAPTVNEAATPTDWMFEFGGVVASSVTAPPVPSACTVALSM